jgi:hypothetical protein
MKNVPVYTVQTTACFRMQQIDRAASKCLICDDADIEQHSTRGE